MFRRSLDFVSLKVRSSSGSNYSEILKFCGCNRVATYVLTPLAPIIMECLGIAKIVALEKGENL